MAVRCEKKMEYVSWLSVHCVIASYLAQCEFHLTARRWFATFPEQQSGDSTYWQYVPLQDCGCQGVSPTYTMIGRHSCELASYWLLTSGKESPASSPHSAR